MIPSSPPYVTVPLRRPHNYSSGRETTEVCQPSSLQVAFRARLGTQLQQKVPANLLLLKHCEPEWD